MSGIAGVDAGISGVPFAGIPGIGVSTVVPDGVPIGSVGVVIGSAGVAGIAGAIGSIVGGVIGASVDGVGVVIGSAGVAGIAGAIGSVVGGVIGAGGAIGSTGTVGMAGGVIGASVADVVGVVLLFAIGSMSLNYSKKNEVSIAIFILFYWQECFYIFEPQ
jgi:hypothetical protein